MTHTSDCATNNGPALPAGPCDCGGALPVVEIPAALAQQLWDEIKAARDAAVQEAVEAMRREARLGKLLAAMRSAGMAAHVPLPDSLTRTLKD